MKVCFETFGCRLNKAEALQREAEYLASGWEVTTKHSEADLIVIRGCSVTARAQHDCEKMIEHLKRHYPLKRMIVEGCIKRTPAQERVKDNVSAPSALPVRTARAYLKVQDGCNGKCTFCIVPQFRGKSVSVSATEILDRAKRFIDAGYHELVVTGCNLALYASEGKRLPQLVADLADLTRDCRVRIGSLEPGAAALETVDVMAERENVCRFLHIPVQSGANRILTAMLRPYLIKDVEELVKKATDKMPLIGLGCDIITGFPGEMDVDYVATMGLIRRLPFSNVHVFPFSPRPNTIAAGLPGSVPRELSHSRAHELADIAKVHRGRFAKKFIGKEVEMLIEDEKNLTGWTGEYFGCEITNKKKRTDLKRKDLVRVHVMDAHHAHLSAIVI